MHVRPAQAQDRSRLLDLWERSVRATHHFLTDADIVTLRPLVAQELASDTLDWWVLVISPGEIGGLLAYTPATIEGLFVDPDHQGRGGGKALVAHAQKLAGNNALSVDVNEPNEAALSFYKALGFIVAGRSPTDAGGRPFPILHLRRESQGPQAAE